jgi:hypothetical protein
MSKTSGRQRRVSIYKIIQHRTFTMHEMSVLFIGVETNERVKNSKIVMDFHLTRPLL